MKRITITINTTNAAFEDNGFAAEVASILHNLAFEMNGVECIPQTLCDTNGYVCGTVVIESETGE
jgi:hypothetical protein